MMRAKIVLMVMVAMLVCGFAYAGNRDRPVKQFQTSVTVTNVSSEILSENLAGRDVFIQNNDATGIIYLNFTTTATVSNTMIKLSPGEKLSSINITNAIYAIGSISSNPNIVVLEGR